MRIYEFFVDRFVTKYDAQCWLGYMCNKDKNFTDLPFWPEAIDVIL